ncbi:hypothetical protein CDAR_240351 [Caerostris darwini]|uniref:Uncharacterized protein n=1 Tax=Caerostris darwini TaxID=1538125 RepID=A0AAV4SWY3_9ARAC|nr:hypothetical protein CDAR_240351 [Caerostris darwini]
MAVVDKDFFLQASFANCLSVAQESLFNEGGTCRRNWINGSTIPKRCDRYLMLLETASWATECPLDTLLLSKKRCECLRRERRFWKRRNNGRRRQRLLSSGGRSLIACQWPKNHYSMKAARAEESGSMDPPSRRGVAYRFICHHIVYQIKDKIPAQQ